MARERRSDFGKKRRPTGKYKITNDETGKVGTENRHLTSFWRKHKVADFMEMDDEEVEEVLEKWFETFEAIQIKRDPRWQYPNIPIPIAKARNKRTGLDKNPTARYTNSN